MLKKHKNTLLGLLVFALYAIASTMEYNDQVADKRAHCLKMVADGVWAAGVCEP